MLNWVELDAAALRHNLGEFRSRLGPSVKLGAVVKANAYGHGMLEVAGRMRELADWLCVNSLEEAVALREAGHDQPLLVMGYISQDGLEAVVRHELRAVIANPRSLETLARLTADRDRPLPVHLKLETGTHRQGIAADRVLEAAELVRRAPGLELEGVCTHFANIEDTTDHRFAESQIRSFDRLVETLRGAGYPNLLRHTACSAAALLFTRTHMELARIGISLYGLWPSKETYVSCLDRGKPALDLHPALTWKTRLAQVKAVAEGGYVGYGCAYRATRASKIAVLPVGYFEGYDRGLSGVAHVLVRGRRAPVCGRICMNMCMVDVTDIAGVDQEDEVVLLGRQGQEQITAEQLAEWSGTISYEIVSRIQSDIPRVVVGD